MEPTVDLMSDSADHLRDDSASIADLFRVASHELAKSDARLYRSLDKHLKITRELLSQDESPTQRLSLKEALGSTLLTGNSFEKQTRSSLQQLCRDNGIKGFSRMSKSAMIERLVAIGIAAPQIPLEALSKAELIEALRQMMMHESHA